MQEISWRTIHHAISGVCWNSVEEQDVVEFEDLGVPLMERALVKDSQENELESWQHFSKRTKHLYICRILGETRGNIAEASRLSGMGRNQIYKMLDELNVDRSAFI